MIVGMTGTVLIQTNFILNSNNSSQSSRQNTSNIPKLMTTAPKVGKVLRRQKSTVTNKKSDYNNGKDLGLAHSFDSSLSSSKNGLQDQVLISETQKNQASVNSFNGNSITQMNMANSNNIVPNSINSGLTVTLSPSSAIIDESQTQIFNATVTGGYPRYTFLWISPPSGCTMPSNIPSSLICTPTVTGTYTIELDVTDTSTNSGSATSSLTINPFVSVTAPTATPATKKADVGQNVHFEVTVSGGTPPLTIQWVGLWKGCNPGNTASFTCRATTNGTFDVAAPVIDSLGNSAWGAASTYQVLPNISIGTPTASSPYINLGQSVKFTASPTGGTGTYTYAWANLPTGCVDSGKPIVSCTPTVKGTFNINVTITDSNSFSITSSTLSFKVNDDLTVSAPTTSSNNGQVGTKFTFTTTSKGGSGTNTYTWSSSSTDFVCSSSTTDYVSCVPSAVGDYHVTVTVKDSVGGTANATSATIHVTSTSSKKALPSFTALISIIAILPIGVVGILRKRRLS